MTELQIDYEKAERVLEKLAAEYHQKHRLWRETEDRVLLLFYRRVSMIDLEEELQRTQSAMATRVDKLRKRGLIPECDK